MNFPDQDISFFTAGAPLDQARAAMLMLHGRGATAQDILGLAGAFDQPGFVYLAPQAPGFTWYPYSFLSPLEQNEPWLSSALATVASGLQQLNATGFSPERTILLGFSQGACLALEFAARNARRYAGLIGLSGGLVGPPGTPRAYPGSLAGTPVFLGCSDIDPHIPQERVLESEQVLRQLGGEVTTRIYPDMGHTINQDEIDFIHSLMERLIDSQ